MSRATSDVDEIQSFIVNGIDVIIGEGLLWFVCVALVMALDWRVASASLAPLIVVYILLRIFNARIQPIYKEGARAHRRGRDTLAGKSLRHRGDQDFRPREGRGRSLPQRHPGVLPLSRFARSTRAACSFPSAAPSDSSATSR
jgi:ABC-type multidrug transport system fused ATPase/permease subunit